MNPDDFARLKEILLQAADLSEGERQRYLDDVCKNDSDLRREAESILARDADASRILEMGGVSRGSAVKTSPSGDGPEALDIGTSPGQTLGSYVLRERIGSGGMGEVWRAEQRDPVRRTVALKLIKAGMDTGQVIARFEAERQALALMDHPVIAKVYDAGTTAQGRPYFAMEYVPGVPITEYCDARKLGTQERLELFQRVCEGVQHAHQKAVIHRDLKPSNILVADVDGKPQPRIIDFGVAKATTQKLTEKTMYTAMGQLIGTPEYMSPEQANLTVEDVDTRTDVYSLGVILYELLAGALPFDSTQLRKAGFEGIIRLLREKDPPRPSTKVSSLGEKTTEVAEKRRTESRRLVRQLKGDLDWIVMRSLEKDRNRRYGSPQELAQDIQRHLYHQPVLAGPPSAVYRARKFMKRNRIAVGFGATILLAVALGFVLLTVQNARIAAARDEAESVVTTLEEMLASVDPTKSGRDVTVKEMLDETAKTLGERFKNQPLVEARVQHTVGRTYTALGEYTTAEEHLRRAVKIRQERLGAGALATLRARNDLTNAYQRLNRTQEAASFARETVEIARRVYGGDQPITLRSMCTLAASLMYQDSLVEAEAVDREALEISRRVLGEDHSRTLSIKYGLSQILSNEGRYEEAATLARETLEVRRRRLGDEHPSTLGTMRTLAYALRSQGRYDEAETLEREVVEIQSRVLGDEHPETLISKHYLAWTLLRLKRYDEAEAAHREALESSLRVHGEDSGMTNIIRYNLACNLARMGRHREANATLREAVQHGFGSLSWRKLGMAILEDSDLVSLHGDPEFGAIVEELNRKRAEETKSAAE